MRTVVDAGEAGRLVLDEPAPHGGTGDGPTPLQAVLGALCGCEAVTFRRTATELGLAYSALDFEAAFTIDIRGRQGNRSVRPYFQTVRVRAVVSTAELLEKLAAVIEETEPLPGHRAVSHERDHDLHFSRKHRLRFPSGDRRAGAPHSAGRGPGADRCQ